MKLPAILLAILATLAEPSAAMEFGGWAELEGRYFPGNPLFAGQRQNSVSGAIQPEIYQEWGNGSSFAFVPFYRADSADSQRTHFDIREAMFLWPGNSFELRAGIGKVFWGATEANHLVDIINQTDLVDSIDGETKLGQPMVNLTVPTMQGVFDFFVLPYFRERTFPGQGGRLRFDPPIDTGPKAAYESIRERKHVDYAFRYSHTAGGLDFGLSAFHGTTREPAYLLDVDDEGNPGITPFYEIIDQAGLDLQYIAGAWLWKMEAIYRDGLEDGSFYALDAGIEYTFSGPALRGRDLGLIVEYLYDSRDFDIDFSELAAGRYISSRFNTFLNNDYLLGVRLALNDTASSEMLLGYIRDIDNGSSVIQLEASRRIGDSWKLELDVYAFVDVEKDLLLNFLRRDSFAQLALKYYF